MAATISLEYLNRYTTAHTRLDRAKIPLDEICPDCDGIGYVPISPELARNEPWKSLREEAEENCLARIDDPRNCDSCDKAPLMPCPLCEESGRDPEAQARKHLRSLAEAGTGGRRRGTVGTL